MGWGHILTLKNDPTCISALGVVMIYSPKKVTHNFD